MDFLNSQLTHPLPLDVGEDIKYARYITLGSVNMDIQGRRYPSYIQECLANIQYTCATIAIQALGRWPQRLDNLRFSLFDSKNRPLSHAVIQEIGS